MSLIDLPMDDVDLIFRQDDLGVPYTDGFKVDGEELERWHAFETEGKA